MKNNNLKYIILGVFAVLLVISLTFTIVKKVHKNKNVLKDTNVTVTIDMSEEPKITEETQADIDIARQAEEDAGFSIASSKYNPDETTTSSTTEEVTEGDASTEAESTEPNEVLTFSYNEITANNYVNFIEQLCCVTSETIDVDTLPVSDDIKAQIKDKGCLNQNAVTYSFITTDNGFNDEDNSFYVNIHIPNDTKDYVMVEGTIVDNVLDTVNLTVME